MPRSRVTSLCAFVPLCLCAFASAAPPEINFTIDGSNSHPISPYIYGHNQADFKTQKNLTLTRWGGNRTTAYNWETNASNAGCDWLHQNDDYLSKSNAPAAPVLALITAAHKANAAAIITIPTIGHVAADKNNDGDVNKTPDYLAHRFVPSFPSNGRRPTTSRPSLPRLTGECVYQSDFIEYLEKSFPESRTSPATTIFYALDNEPDLWAETHARIHPAKITYAELIKNNIEYAAAIKAIAPQALVFGFCSYGFAGFSTLQDAPDADKRNILDVYLAAMAAAEKTAGKRLIDVVDLHWYPEARANNIRIIEDNADPAAAAARIQAPRSLWDPAYTEESWITKDHTHGHIALIPTVKARIAQHYPGTKLALAEYYFGGGDHISGALAQADALGIFAREDLFAAALWHIGKTHDPYILGAFQMYLDYDAQGSTVGNTSLAATTTDTARASLYATRNPAGQLVLVALNKTDHPLTTDTLFKDLAPLPTSVSLYRLTAADPHPHPAGPAPLTESHLFLTLPAYSITTIVIPAN